MRKIYPRNVKATFCPKVTCSTYSQRVVVTTGGWQGKQAYNIAADMSIETARTLILDLRKALREIRDETIKRVQGAVSEAEKPL